MNIGVVNQFVENNIQFHLMPTDKFKTITVVVKLKAPLDRETVTKRALLPFVLQKGTANYPSEKQLREKLDELYGAVLQIERSKKGEHHILHFQLDFANEKFVPNSSNLTEEALRLLYETIYEPRKSDSGFVESIVQREKKQLENKIKSIYDQKIYYANERLIEEMYKNEPYSIKKDGYIEDLSSINGVNLYDYYLQMLVNNDIDLFVIGDFEIEKMKSSLLKFFSQKEKITKNDVQSRKKEIVAPQKIVEKDSIHQAKLHIGYRTFCTYKDDQYAALQVFNGLYGGFPSSKLFLNVREKHSLAYYVGSRIESHIGLLIVYSGVETEEYERTCSIIQEQLDALRQGQFTEEELAEIKKLIISQVMETLDHPSGTIELLYQRVVANSDLSIEQLLEKITKVTKEEVVDIANKVALDTTYVLAGEAGEGNGID